MGKPNDGSFLKRFLPFKYGCNNFESGDRLYTQCEEDYEYQLASKYVYSLLSIL